MGVPEHLPGDPVLNLFALGIARGSVVGTEVAAVLFIQRLGQLVGRFLHILTRLLAQTGGVHPFAITGLDGLVTDRLSGLFLALGHRVPVKEQRLVPGLQRFLGQRVVAQTSVPRQRQ